ncbi:hypothetical protein ANCCEY_05602 [Ancylostoma ceylanicum]|uniref:Uncharacterized protein n=1 Tax=Ancylostoma ceylanicum TaxID=53326 RepID=A0A0D6M5Z7_9BILA|nr:hypothetical protein ANCCEY_05602 [Ancylostoma ceylanicum]
MENATIPEEDGELYELSLCELIFWCILYAVIALLAVIGNSLVIFVTLLRLSGVPYGKLNTNEMNFSSLPEPKKWPLACDTPSEGYEVFPED